MEDPVFVVFSIGCWDEVRPHPSEVLSQVRADRRPSHPLIAGERVKITPQADSVLDRALDARGAPDFLDHLIDAEHLGDDLHRP